MRQLSTRAGDAIPDLEAVPLQARRVAVFVPVWGNPSETFIADHVHSLTRYRPLVLSWERVAGGPAAVPIHCYSHCWSVARVLNAAQAHLRLPWRSAWRYFAAVCVREHAALLHAHFLGATPEAAAAAQKAGIPFIVSCHGTDVFADLPRTPERLRRHILGGATRLIVHSQAVRTQLLSYGADPAKVVQVNLGVNAARFAPAPETARGPLRVICVARHISLKGHRYLLPAFAEVRRVHPQARLVLIGDGPLRRELEARTATLGIRDAVAFAGAVPSAGVAEELRQCHLAVVPSVTCPDGSREGFGLAALEAQAAGLPVVATTSGGLPEAVRDGVTGLIVPEQDSEALAEAMLRLARDPELRLRLGRAGRARVLADFTIAGEISRFERLYDEVCAAPIG